MTQIEHRGGEWGTRGNPDIICMIRALSCLSNSATKQTPSKQPIRRGGQLYASQIWNVFCVLLLWLVAPDGCSNSDRCSGRTRAAEPRLVNPRKREKYDSWALCDGRAGEQAQQLYLRVILKI